MFMSEAPTGDADVEDENWTPERLRAKEERAATAGRRDVRTFALTRDGEVAAMTELFVNVSMPHRGFQSGTLVVPAHRGHRLGLAVKVANQRALVDRFPELEWIITGNADVNAHMNAINDRLGFRVVERCLEVEKARSEEQVDPRVGHRRATALPSPRRGAAPPTYAPRADFPRGRCTEGTSWARSFGHEGHD